MDWRLNCFKIFILPFVSFVLGGCMPFSFRWADDIHEFAVVDNQNPTPIAHLDFLIDDYAGDDFSEARRDAGLPVYGSNFWLFALDSNDRFLDFKFWDSDGSKYEMRNIAGNTISTIELIDEYQDDRGYRVSKIREISRYILKNGGELKIDCVALIVRREFKIEKIGYFYGENQKFDKITKEEFFAKKQGGQGK